MLRAALSYVEAGWPIVPGAAPSGATALGRVRALLGAGPVPVSCWCGSGDCTAPAAHPLGPDWADQHVRTEPAARFWWDHQRGPVPNIVLCCGEFFEVLSVPAEVGSYALGLIDSGAAPVTPVAITPERRWHFFTAPGRGLELPPGLDVVRLGAGRYVPAPPSTRGSAGRDRWLVAPRRRRLPEARTVAAAMILAAEQPV